jgi:hypothetical protein
MKRQYFTPTLWKRRTLDFQQQRDDKRAVYVRSIERFTRLNTHGVDDTDNSKSAAHVARLYVFFLPPVSSFIEAMHVSILTVSV